MKSPTTFPLIKEESQKIGLELSEETINQFEAYLHELMKWNQKINLTGHKEEKFIIGNLFIDSLAFHKVLKEKKSGSVLDVGSGAGFPGLPLKMSEPKLSVTLVEPNLKKVSFLHHLIGTLELKNVEVEPKRIEDLSKSKKYENLFDFIFLKALRFDVCLPYVRPLLSDEGKLILSRSKKNEKTEETPGFFVHEEIFYELPFGFGERVLIVLSPTNN